MENLLQPLIKDGEVIKNIPGIEEAKKYVLEQMKHFENGLK